MSKACEDWRPGPPKPVLRDGEVHVWWAQLDEAGGLSGPLSPDEQNRAARILPPHSRAGWAASRILLRAILGRYLGLEPGRVELATGAHGKPLLAGCAAEIDFSLSHCRGEALLAVARGRRVGVDLELPRQVPKASSLARRAFGVEQARGLEALHPALRDGAFLRLWTRHEAELKCAGTGLLARGSGGDRCWTLELPTSALGAVGAPDSAAEALEPGGAVAAATLALDAPPGGVRLWRWCSGPTRSGSEDADGDRLRERRAFVDGREDDVGAVVLA